MEEVEGERVREEGRGVDQLGEILSVGGGDGCAGENE